MPKPAKRSILKTKSEAFQHHVKEAPLLPGCYIYVNEEGEYLYIGKAKVLRNRIRSYFNNYYRLEPRISQMIDQAVDINYITVDSEAEALILESNLIKKYKPRYNIRLRDDKGYVYVKFDRFRASVDENDWQTVPSISVVREKQKNDAIYYGPFASVQTVKRLLKRLRKIFPYCTGKSQVLIPKDKNEPFISKSHKPCFGYHIDLCDGVCVGAITRKEYESQINNIKKFFKSEKTNLLDELEKEMQRAAKQKNYERAAKMRDRIRDLRYVGRSMIVDKDSDEVAIMKAKKERREAALTDLVTRLDFPEKALKLHKGLKIECYDISNIQGTNAVGSMVVFVDGEPRPDLYRRFKIKTIEGPNDFGMLQEVLTRRFNQYLRSELAKTKGKDSVTQEEHTDNEGFTIQMPKELEQRMKNWKPDESFSQLPDLMIIDGGKGQLSSTYRILQQYNLVDQLPIVGLAKREEEIFKVNEQFSDLSESVYDPEKHQKFTHVPIDAIDGFDLVRLPRRSESLYLVQRIRDEAHRFAITYHRKLRSTQLKRKK